MGYGVGVQDGVGVGLWLRHWALGLQCTSCRITGPDMDWCHEVVHMMPQERLVAGLWAAHRAGAGLQDQPWRLHSHGDLGREL